MTRDTIPENFTLGLTAVDSIPVILFGFTFILLGLLLKSVLFITGAAVCIAAGLGKVFWKLIVVLKHKNIWFLFVQLRVLMPAGFILMLVSLIICRNQIDFSLLWNSISSFPSILFFIAGLILMILMMIFAVKLDSSDIKSNWIEQIVNAFAQLCFFLGVLFILIK